MANYAMRIMRLHSRLALPLAGSRSHSFHFHSFMSRSFSTAQSYQAVRPQNSLPAAYYRGGTSRAVFFKQHDLPKNRGEWSDIFRGVIGSPDPHGRQLDGLGGGISSLSKICVVGKSSREDADVDYTFVALGIKDDDVDYSSNCGNMTSAVGPFAVDERLVDVQTTGSDNTTTVRIHNTNTGKIIHSTFLISDDGSEAASSGEFAIDGVSGHAARIQLDFVDPAGSRTGKLLPTGNPVDVFDGINVTCIDVGNPCCFVRAADLNVEANITPDEIDTHPVLLSQLNSLRRQAGVAMGIADSPAAVPGSVPKIGLVGPPATNSRAISQNQTAETVDLLIRALSVGQPHKAVPITVALSIAAAARVPGSVVAACVQQELVDPAGITVGHASGKLLVGAQFESDGRLACATVYRTARRIMEGRVFWK
ncbi:DUF453 domain protein [Pseudovirgaria hyperparasitica]|uniref:DUF453 domain protein n=1 Tax=Pseudovirgaria hyperparasitica TaxID=470096 RepID=A0A6A6W721_9PEZI|nr:DUF453 domain protein [Pseudovirgaria hyperparasitica]KAF2757999.1 DUF453 domain protein [Pseudovirgaria hyperparasitica]